MLQELLSKKRRRLTRSKLKSNREGQLALFYCLQENTQRISMTPAIKLLTKLKIAHTLHAYHHDPNHGAYGMEAAEKLGIDPVKVFKTLIIELVSGKLACAIIPVAETLNLKSAAKALGAKKAAMAKIEDAERSTGYIKGGVSPFGQKKRLATIVDESAAHQQTILVSGGKRGLDIELATDDLVQVLNAGLAAICV